MLCCLPFGYTALKSCTGLWIQIVLLWHHMTIVLLQGLDLQQQLPQAPLLHPSLLPLGWQPPQLHTLLPNPHLHSLPPPQHPLNLPLHLHHHHHLASPRRHLPLASQLLRSVKQHRPLVSLWQPAVQHQRSLGASHQQHHHQHQGSQA